MRESQKDVSKLLEGADMVFVAVGMGGGTGTGAASLVADLARKAGALTVGVATLPFGFEGPRRRENAEEGLKTFQQKVDTLIVVENDRLLPALDGNIELERAFKLADEVLHQGVRGISDIITMNGMINVDFADVKAIMSNGGAAFMAMGSGQGNDAAAQAAQAALSNPLFDMPLEGAKGILLNIMGGAGPHAWRGPPGGGGHQGRRERGRECHLRGGAGQADEEKGQPDSRGYGDTASGRDTQL